MRPSSDWHSRGVWKLAVVASLALFVAGSLPTRCRACSCISRPVARSNPAKGAEDVPRNQAIVIEGNLDPRALALRDAAGKRIAFKLNHGPVPGCPGTWAELVPIHPLAADTKHTVRVVSTFADRQVVEISFTTGSKSLPETSLAIPRGSVSLVRGVPAVSQCYFGDVHGCVGIADEQNIEIVARKGTQILMRWLLSNRDSEFSLYEAPDCIELRRRSPTGQRSAPLELCGAALGLRSYRQGDVRGYDLLCKDGVIGSDTPGPDDVPAPPSDAQLVLEAAVEAARRNAAATAQSSPSAPGPALPAPTSSQPRAAPKAERFGCSAVPGSNRAWGLAFGVLLLLLASARAVRPRSRARY